MTDKIIALIADVVTSRKIRDRIAFNNKLSDTIGRFNKKINDPNSSLLACYTITAGDEIQALFKKADSLFYEAILILSEIYPEKIRFSYGIGTLITPINQDLAIGMDGEAFYNARKGVENLKHMGKLFNIVGDTIPNLNLLKQTLFLISHNISKCNKTRLQVLAMLLKDVPVKKIAKELQISDKAVYKTINAGDLKVIIQLFDEIKNILNESMGR